MTQATEWHPNLVSWNVTQRCNLHCKHCYLAAGQPAAGELSLEEGYRLIDQLADAGTRMLILTGGEPLMRRDIVKLAEHASSKGILLVVGTNGMLMTPRTVERLKAAGVGGAGISLDSLQPEKHDAFRGVSGAWKGALRGIHVCVTQELPVLLQMTALSWNYQEILDMAEFAHRQGVAGFTLYFLVCTGRGEHLTDITPQQYEEAFASLVKAQQRFPGMMVRARCAPHIARLASQQGSALVGSAGCLAARQYCRITPEGDVTPCPYLPLVGGNVRQQSFEEVWQSTSVFQKLRNGGLGGKCGLCDFRQMCGGCRARAFALSNDALAEDPWCTYQPVEGVSPKAAAHLLWTQEAEERLQRIPSFVRSKVKLAVERYAKASGKVEITPQEMSATLESLGRQVSFHRSSR